MTSCSKLTVIQFDSTVIVRLLPEWCAVGYSGAFPLTLLEKSNQCYVKRHSGVFIPALLMYSGLSWHVQVKWCGENFVIGGQSYWKSTGIKWMWSFSQSKCVMTTYWFLSCAVIVPCSMNNRAIPHQNLSWSQTWLLLCECCWQCMAWWVCMCVFEHELAWTSKQLTKIFVRGK